MAVPQATLIILTGQSGVTIRLIGTGMGSGTGSGWGYGIITSTGWGSGSLSTSCSSKYSMVSMYLVLMIEPSSPTVVFEYSFYSVEVVLKWSWVADYSSARPTLKSDIKASALKIFFILY